MKSNTFPDCKRSIMSQTHAHEVYGRNMSRCIALPNFRILYNMAYVETGTYRVEKRMNNIEKQYKTKDAQDIPYFDLLCVLQRCLAKVPI